MSPLASCSGVPQWLPREARQRPLGQAGWLWQDPAELKPRCLPALAGPALEGDLGMGASLSSPGLWLRVSTYSDQVT